MDKIFWPSFGFLPSTPLRILSFPVVVVVVSLIKPLTEPKQIRRISEGNAEICNALFYWKSPRHWVHSSQLTWSLQGIPLMQIYLKQLTVNSFRTFSWKPRAWGTCSRSCGGGNNSLYYVIHFGPLKSTLTCIVLEMCQNRCPKKKNRMLGRNLQSGKRKIQVHWGIFLSGCHA